MADNAFPSRLASLPKQRENIICPLGASAQQGNLQVMYNLSPVGLVMFSAAFDKLVYGEGKYYRLRGRLCTSLYDDIILTHQARWMMMLSRRV